MSSKKRFKKAISFIICIAVILQLFSVASYAVSSTIMSYAPAGTRDIAVDAYVTCSSSEESPTGYWGLKNINDGKLQNETGGFSTSTSENVPDEYTVAWFIFDLEGYYDIQKVVLFSFGAFPDSYNIEVSKDNVNYTTAASDSGQAGNRINKEYSIENADYIRYVRLYVTKRGDFDGNRIRLVQFSEIAIFGTECSPTDNSDDISSFSPENCVNLAPECKVSSNDSIENTYISVNYINNNSYTDQKFFSSMTSGADSGDVYIDFEIEDYALIKRVIIFRTGIFPKVLKIQVSNDGENFTTVKTGKGYAAFSPGYVAFDLDTPVYAKYVRVLATHRNHGNGVEETRYFVQYGEIGIYGIKRAYQTSLNKNSLTLLEGESINLTHSYKVKSFDEGTHTTAWVSQNPSIASVDSDGNVTANSAGTTYITTTDEVTGITDTCEVIVKKENDSITDSVITSMWQGPLGNLMNDEQYQLIADAGIDLIYNTGSTVSNNIKAIKYAHKHGMSVIINDYNMSSNCENMTKEEVTEWYEKYRGMSGIGGIFVKDEPKNPNVYARVYNYLKEVNPSLFVHLNFLPGFVYDSYEQYEYQLDDFAQLTNDTDYLMFDIYPFLNPTGVDYNKMFKSYNAVRKAGLKNNVKTAAYIQAVGYGPAANENFSKRIPTATDIIYQDMISLAYGAKHISYFKWGGGGSSVTEKFSDGGIDGEGNPTATYYNIQSANAIVHNLGKTLIDLDAKEVYLSGSNTYSQETIPQGFFVNTTSNDSLVFSYMRNRETGRNYLMVVNNNIDSSVSPSLTFNSEINKISVINNETGVWSDVNLNGSYKPTIAAGSAVLLALPEGYDYGSTAKEANSNLAYHSSVGGTSSIGEDGWYLSCLTDGYTASNASLGLKGWCSELKDNAYQTEVVINLNEPTPFNSLTLYPSDERMQYFPKSYTVSVSVDGESWTQIASENNVQAASTKTYNTDYVYAKYIKLSVTDMNAVDGKYAAALSEITLSSGLSIIRHKEVPDGFNGYYVYACCAGSSYVKMPSWTENKGQDDIVWYVAENGDWQVDGKSYNYRCYIPVSSHNNEHGKYITHIYAYKTQQEYKAIATSYEFKADFTFNMNYGDISENLVKDIETAASGGGLTVSYDGSAQALTINGTMTANNILQSFVPFDKPIKNGDRIKVTVEKLGGTTNNIFLTTELLNSSAASPCGTRTFRDIPFGASAVFEINSDSLANEISGYKLWLYYSGTGNQSVNNLKFRVKIELESGAYVYSPEKISVKYGENFGTFYNPSDNGDGTFAGWFTAPEGGERVDLKSVNTEYIGSVTLYAHWNVPATEYLSGITTGLTSEAFESEYLNTENSVIVYRKLNENGIVGTGTDVELRDVKTGLLKAKYIVVLYGDVNGDGWYDAQDSVVVNCITQGLISAESISEAERLAADCNHDGTIDNFDVTILQKAGLLLVSLDRTMSREEPETSSAYNEYIELIDQNLTTDQQTENPIDSITAILDYIRKIIIVFLNQVMRLFTMSK